MHPHLSYEYERHICEHELSIFSRQVQFYIARPERVNLTSELSQRE